MRKLPLILSSLGTLTMFSSLATLLYSIFTSEWLTISEAVTSEQSSQNWKFDNTYPSSSKIPDLLKAQLGLFRTCTYVTHSASHSTPSQPTYCTPPTLTSIAHFFKTFDLFYQPAEVSSSIQSELVLNCIRNIRLSLPFIVLSAVFTIMAFGAFIFGSSFCSKGRKLVEATFLICAGLCQATALLTFVSQIGSEFESWSNSVYFPPSPAQSASNSFPFHDEGSAKRSSYYYRYKYGFSFYLFLASFSLAEIAALLDMVGYFKKQKKFPNNFDCDQQQAQTYGMETLTRGGGGEPLMMNKHPDICEESHHSLQHHHHHHHNNFDDSYYLSPEVVIVQQQKETSCFYGTTGGNNRANKNKLTALESFATIRSHNHAQHNSILNMKGNENGGEELNKL